jgi:leucyl aminopeptidase
MADSRKLGFGPIAAPGSGVLVVFVDDNLRFGPRTRSLLGSTADMVTRAARAERFSGKGGTALDIVAPAGLKAARLIVMGTGKAADRKSQDLVKLGGAAMGRVPSAASEATVFLELADGPLKPDAAAHFALGAKLRAYSFDRYKTKRKEGEEQPAKAEITLGVADPAGARKAWNRREISSTNRRISSIRPNSRAARRRCASSASASTFSTSRRCTSSEWVRCSG